MIAIIQCAASKRPGGYLQTARGVPVEFVADPKAAPNNRSVEYARPDDLSDYGPSWRQFLVEYNQEPKRNPLSLYPAYRLYENKVYGRLVDQIGTHKVYILSAGWGLIRADFLTPHYDITFTLSADRYKQRKRTDHYDDFCMLPGEADDTILFFGGKEYQPMFHYLTTGVKGKRVIFYNSAIAPKLQGCVFERFVTTTRTNWHYECVNAFLSGNLSIG
jgi:hypothetical protein